MKRMKNKVICCMIVVMIFAVGVPLEANASVSPAKVTGLRSGGATQTSVTLKWKKAPRASKYKVYRITGTYKKHGIIRYKYRLIKTTKKRSATIKSLKEGKVYRFRVRAFRGSRKGAFSKICRVKTRPIEKVNASGIRLCNNRMAAEDVLYRNWKSHKTHIKIYSQKNLAYSKAAKVFTGGELFSYGEDDDSGVLYGDMIHRVPGLCQIMPEKPYKTKVLLNGKTAYRYSYELNNYYSRNETDKMAAEIDRISGSLKGTDEEKIYQLIDYENENTEYDESITRFYPYDNIVGKCSVCDGYASAGVILLRRAGVECEYVSGGMLDENFRPIVGHAWNIVKLYGKWYELDLTLGHGRVDGCEEEMIYNAKYDEIYKTAAWRKLHPMAKKPLAPDGKCPKCGFIWDEYEEQFYGKFDAKARKWTCPMCEYVIDRSRYL